MASWLRSSTAVSESKPRPRNSRSTSTVAASEPSTAATWARTTSSSALCCSLSRSPDSRSRRAFAAGVARPAPRRLVRPTGRSSHGGSAGRAPRQVQPHRHERGLGGARGAVEQRAALLDRQRRHAGAGHPVAVGVGEGAGHAGLPRAPGQRRRGEPAGVPAGGERVEEGVGGGVVRLARRAEGAGDRGEQDERSDVAGQLVQVPGGVDLRAQHGGEPVGVERAEDAVVEDAGGVHDGGQRPLGGDARRAGSARASRSARSQAATVTSVPWAASSATSSTTPSAAPPRRLTSSRCRTPYSATRCRAKTRPSPPVPPVIRTVPSGFHCGRSWVFGARPRRATRALPSPQRAAGVRRWRARRAARQGRRRRRRRARTGPGSRSARSGPGPRRRPRRGRRAGDGAVGDEHDAGRVSLAVCEDGEDSAVSAVACPRHVGAAVDRDRQHVRLGGQRARRGPGTPVPRSPSRSSRARPTHVPSAVPPDSGSQSRRNSDSGPDRDRRRRTQGAARRRQHRRAGLVGQVERVSESSAARAIRARTRPRRTRAAPHRPRRTAARPARSQRRTIACSTASSSAGCRPNCSAFVAGQLDLGEDVVVALPDALAGRGTPGRTRNRLRRSCRRAPSRSTSARRRRAATRVSAPAGQRARGQRRRWRGGPIGVRPSGREETRPRGGRRRPGRRRRPARACRRRPAPAARRRSSPRRGRSRPGRRPGRPARGTRRRGTAPGRR